MQYIGGMKVIKYVFILLLDTMKKIWIHHFFWNNYMVKSNKVSTDITRQNMAGEMCEQLIKVKSQDTQESLKLHHSLPKTCDWRLWISCFIVCQTFSFLIASGPNPPKHFQDTQHH